MLEEQKRGSNKDSENYSINDPFRRPKSQKTLGELGYAIKHFSQEHIKNLVFLLQSKK